MYSQQQLEQFSEPSDPVAHPHYPNRPARATHPIYVVLDEPILDEDEDDS